MKNRMLVYFVAIAVLSTIVPIALFTMTNDAEGQDPGQPMMLNDMKLFMKEGMSLTPLPPDTKDEYQAISIPNGFIRDGLFGRGFLPIGHTYWKDVGKWDSQPLKETINLGGRVEVVIFATREEGSGPVSSDFEFTIMRGTEPLLVLGISNQRINDGVDNRISATDWFPSGNDTTIEAGTSISLMIRARCNGGAILKFGSSDVPSGFHFGSNALEILNIFMDKEKVTVEYKDAFMVPWIKLYTELKVDTVIQPNYQMSSEMNTLNRTREIIWARESSPDTYEVFISMSYHYSGEHNISDVRTLKIERPHVSTFENVKNAVTTAFPIVVLIAIIIFVLALLVSARKKTWRRRFKELPEPMQQYSKHKKKKNWKDINKKRKQVDRESRKVEKEKKEDVEEDFTLFKRKQKKAPSRRPSVSLNISRETAEELEL
jgi:hypothetical protein